MVQEPSSTTVQDGSCKPVSHSISGFSSSLLTSASVGGATGAPPPVEVSDAEASTSCASACTSADTKGSGVGMTSVATSESAVATGSSIKMEEGVHAAEAGAENLADGGSEDEDDEKEGGSSGGGKSGKSRRELPAGAVATLKAWLLSPEHFTHPYPTPQDQVMLMQKTGIDKKQLKNWFTNARRRIWKPMLKKQLEQGKLAATGAGGGGVVAMPGGIPGLIVTTPGAIPGALPTAVAAPPTGDFAAAPNASAPSNVESSMQTMQVHYQQALQQQQQQQQQQQTAQQSQQGYEIYTYAQQQGQQGQQVSAAGAPMQALPPGTYFIAQPQYGQQQQQSQAVQPGSGDGTAGAVATAGPPAVAQSSSNDGSAPSSSPAHNMIKADSHAVLMELFARDQDLVRQATEGARAKAAAAAGAPGAPGAPGTATTGTSASTEPSPPDGQTKPDIGATNQGEATNAEQPQSQGPANSAAYAPLDSAKGSVAPLSTWPHFSSLSSLNNINNLKGVKSITNMSGADLASKGNVNNKGNLAHVKSVESMGRHDSYAFLEVFFDDRFGGQPQQQHRGVKREREEDNDVGLSLDADEAPSTSSLMKPPPTLSSTPVSAPSSSDPSKDNGTDNGGKVEHAFDDALAARGLLSVSRSSEKLTDLALPAKMQRTLSQEFLRSSGSSGLFPSFCFPSASNFQPAPLLQESKPPPPAPQPPLPHPGQDQKAPTPAPLADPSASGSSVEVPATTTCALCNCVNVDTQLRPCGHMFHGRCLKPSMQTSAGPPQCPIDHIPMQSAMLAIPAKESK